MFTSLGHRPIGGIHYQNGAIHLGCTGDHVFHIVGVARTVDVRVVAVTGFVLHMCGSDRDAARFFFRRFVNLVKGGSVAAIGLGHDLGDRGGKGRFAMVHVTDGTNVEVRLIALKLFFCHYFQVPVLICAQGATVRDILPNSLRRAWPQRRPLRPWAQARNGRIAW